MWLMEQESTQIVVPEHTHQRRLPFRLGAPSYVIPADIVPNVEFLASHVDDVEILVMESDERSPLPSGQVVTTLKQLAGCHGLTYTVHLPLDIEPGCTNDENRRRSVGKIVRAAQALSALTPFAYVLHLPLSGWRTTNEDDRQCWRQSLARSVREILAYGMEPEDLCVETLDYPFEWIEDLIEEYGLSVCVDVGHLILEGREVLQCLDRYWPRVRILHLHGVVNGKDHRAVSHLDQGLLSRILSRFTNGGERERVVTLEVFDRVRLEESLSLMERIR